MSYQMLVRSTYEKWRNTAQQNKNRPLAIVNTSKVLKHMKIQINIKELELTPDKDQDVKEEKLS